MTDTSDWSTNSTSAFKISLVAPESSKLRILSTFSPKFTYSIFGEEESIFGYKDLKIQLRFHACDMRPHLQITSAKKFPVQGEVVPEDVEGILRDYLPEIAFEKAKNFEKTVNKSEVINDAWTPPGDLLETYKIGEENGVLYEIWMGGLADRAVQQLIKRIQILVPLFIEGGTLIDIEDQEALPRWTIFLLYKKNSKAPKGTSPYTFMGFSTVYKYYMLRTPFKDSTETDSLDFVLPFENTSLENFPCRSRISQFIILPSSQGGGHGSKLYNSIYQHYLKHSPTVEITIEDPNESFDDLRDYNDLTYLRTLPEFTTLALDTSFKVKRLVSTASFFDPAPIKDLREKTKIVPRQFARLVEMQLLSKIPLSIRQSLLHVAKKGTAAEQKLQEHEYYLWRLLAKDRLYRHNKQALMQLDRAERVEKLNEVVNGVEADYARLLRDLGNKNRLADMPPTNGKLASNKRCAIEFQEGTGGSSSASRKKARVADDA